MTDHLSAKIADGDCVVTRLYPSGLRIDHADPRILISTEVLEDIRRDPGPGITLNGDLLRIEGVNRTVIYRIGEKAPDLYAHHAQWPD